MSFEQIDVVKPTLHEEYALYWSDYFFNLQDYYNLKKENEEIFIIEYKEND